MYIIKFFVRLLLWSSMYWCFLFCFVVIFLSVCVCVWQVTSHLIRHYRKAHQFVFVISERFKIWNILFSISLCIYVY